MSRDSHLTVVRMQVQGVRDRSGEQALTTWLSDIPGSKP